MVEKITNRDKFLGTLFVGSMITAGVGVYILGSGEQLSREEEQKVHFEEMGITGSNELIDLRSLPQYDNAPAGFIVFDKTVTTPEPFSQTKHIRMINFAWATPNYEIVISEVPLDKVKIEAINTENSSTPHVGFDFEDINVFNGISKDIDDYINNKLESVTFSLTPDALQDFRGDQLLFTTS